MNKKLISVGVLLLLGVRASAHRLDEYLQAALISLEKDRVAISLRLVPGVAVSTAVLGGMHANGDGLISEQEQRVYAEQVLRDLLLTVDGRRLSPTIVSVKFPNVEAIKEGLGEIRVELAAELPRGSGKRSLVFENHHQERIAAYLVNCLVPRDSDIRVAAQSRNEQQSFYQLDYVQNGSPEPLRSEWWRSARGWMRTVGFAGMFRLGMRHIAEGTDHLLFLLVLLLPAPLTVCSSRWAGCAGVRRSLERICKIVTAFTLGHSITLALAARGVLRVPARPVEVLISVSILACAIHALLPVFPGKEAGIAVFFGLIHGLAFATTLGQLGLGRWERVADVLAFNLGIETMQLLVVAAILPSLLLLSRTAGYSIMRIGGALFAGSASAGWIAERLFGAHIPIDAVVNVVAHRAAWIAAGLFLASLVRWSQRDTVKEGDLERRPLAALGNPQHEEVSDAVNSENLRSGLRRIGPPLQWAGLASVQSRGQTEARADRCCRSGQGSNL